MLIKLQAPSGRLRIPGFPIESPPSFHGHSAPPPWKSIEDSRVWLVLLPRYRCAHLQLPGAKVLPYLDHPKSAQGMHMEIPSGRTVPRPVAASRCESGPVSVLPSPNQGPGA